MYQSPNSEMATRESEPSQSLEHLFLTPMPQISHVMKSISRLLQSCGQIPEGGARTPEFIF